MVSIAQFSIPATGFPFGNTLCEMPDIEIRVDEIVPTAGSVLPYFWVQGCDPAEFIDKAEHEPDISNTQQLDIAGDCALFRAEWHPRTEIIDGIEQIDITIVELAGTSDGWHFDIRATERGDFRRFQHVFEDRGIEVTLHRVFDLTDQLDDSTNLTDRQRATLVAAYEGGYFDRPRDITQSQLGNDFDIGRRAVSDRLRRGVRNLVEDTLITDRNRPIE